MNISEIAKVLPHRYPFVMVDRVVEVTDTYIITRKNVTANEPQFMGHFPENPIFPGALLVEAMAQTGALFIYHMLKDDPEAAEKRMGGYMIGADKLKFNNLIIPGDTVHISATLESRAMSFLRFNCKATVEDNIVAKGQISLYVNNFDRSPV